jgi:hypothetical protein
MNRWLRLVRAPAALTALGDTVAGATAAGRPLRGRGWALPAASAALYWSGMALNDWSDRRRDATERPERPIPSGQIPPGQALAAAVALSAAGTALAVAGAGRRGLRVAVPLTAAIWGYDLLLKSTPAAPLGMAACRALNVLLGAGTYTNRRAVGAAAAMAVHTAGVTALSAGEVHGPRRRAAVAASAATALSTVLAVGGPGRAPRDRATAALYGLAYAVSVGRPQRAAMVRRTATNARAATVAGVHGMIPLQAALIAGGGRPAEAALVATAFPLARALGRRVSPS